MHRGATRLAGNFLRPWRGREKINNLTQSRQGAKGRIVQLLCLFRALSTLRLGVKCFCSCRDFFTLSRAVG
jgi:hypothetical protein